MTPVRVLFLAGMGRSGTTLLERVLAGVPGVVGLGEVMHLWERGVAADELCGCGEPFSACPFWDAVGRKAFGGWDTLDIGEITRARHAVDHVRHVPALIAGGRRRRRGGPEHRGNPAHLLDARDYAEHYVRLYTAAAEITGSRLLVDSSKQASLPHLLAGRPELDLRVVHCIRDARAVSHAWMKQVRRPEAGKDSPDAFMPRYSAVEMSRMWMMHNAAIELLRVQRVAVHRVRYEDFMADPVGTVTALVAFAGFTPGPRDTRHVSTEAVELGVDHTAAGNPMRFTVGRLPLRRDDAWRGSMAPRLQRSVTAMTLPLLARYGYLRRRSRA